MDPVILLFLIGFACGLFKLPYGLPGSLYEGLTYFLLIAIGFKGGIELSGVNILEVGFQSILVASLGVILPLIAFIILRKIGKVSKLDSASIAAHYGSVSVGTFAVTVAYLQQANVPFESYMPFFVILLEVPAIIVGLALAKGLSLKNLRDKELIREVFLGKSIALLGIGLFIGFMATGYSKEALSKFFVDNFTGILGLFLFEMGIRSTKGIEELKSNSLFLISFALFMPLLSSVIGTSIGWLLGLSIGGTTILAVLAASASYIAVPAAVKTSLPDANLSMSLGASLGVTFPFNVMVGIPIYYQLVKIMYH